MNQKFNDAFQNITILVLVISLIVLVFNNRRLSQKLKEDQVREVIIIKPPRDYEKDISKSFDSIRVDVRAVKYDSAVKFNDRYLKDLYRGGTSFEGHIDTSRKGKSNYGTGKTIRGVKGRDH